MINAVRGMRNNAAVTDGGRGAARTNISECTSKVGMYEFSDPQFEQIRLFDIPGSASKAFPREQYYE
jgi:hypothetical protein